MRTFQHPSNGEQAIAAGDAADELLADGWAELDVEASESEPEIEPDIEPDPNRDPDPDPDPDADPDPSANAIPAPDKPLGEMKLTELIAYAEKIGVASEQLDALRKPGMSKIKAIAAINEHTGAEA